MMPCPVLEHFEQTLSAADDLYRRLRKLRRLMDRCQSCPQQGSCAAILELQRKMELALAQVNREFGIVAGSP